MNDKKSLFFLFLVLMSIQSYVIAEQKSSITQYGVTWTFDKEYECGQFITGDWWVVGPVTIQSVSPAPAEGRNGSCVNPMPGKQGYDNRSKAGNVYKTDDRVEFPYALKPDECLVSSVSKPEDVTDFKNSGVMISQAILTAVESLLPEGSFRPAYAGSYKKHFHIDDVQLSILPNLAPPASKPNGETIADYFDMPRVDHVGNWEIQYACAEQNWQNTEHPCYGRGNSQAMSLAGMYVMLNTPERNKIVYSLIQLGIDNYGVIRAGGSWRANGGHNSARKFPIVFAAKMLNDPDMLNLGSDYNGDGFFGEDDQTYYGKNDIPLWGKPCTDFRYFNNDCSGNGSKDCRDPENLVDGCPDYRDNQTSRTWPGQMLATLMIDAKDVWNHDAYFDYVDRWMNGGVEGNTSRAGSTFIEEMWALYRDNLPTGSSDIQVEGVELLQTSISLNEGETASLTAIVTPDNATNQQITWSSNSEDVATVNAHGLVTAIAEGSALVTVKTIDGSFSAQCSISVKKPLDENQKMNLDPTIEKRFKLTHIVWPETIGEADVCIWHDDKIAAATLTIDDNIENEHEWWLSMQDEYDLKLTWFIILSSVSDWGKYQALVDAGNEVQGHDKCNINDLGDAGYDTALKEIKDEINANITGQPCLTYAYPCGEAGRADIARDSYISMRGVVGTLNIVNKLDYLNLNSRSAVNDKADIDRILSNNSSYYRGWLSYHYHGIGSKKDETEGFLSYLYAHENEVWIGGYSEVARYGQERDTHTLTIDDVSNKSIKFTLTDQMYDAYFNFPLTVKLRIRNDWENVKATQNGEDIDVKIVTYEDNLYALVYAIPDMGQVEVTGEFKEVENNNPPTIELSSSIIKVYADSTYFLDISSSDAEGDAVSFFGGTMPGFISLSDNGDGTAQVSIMPKKEDIGEYKDITFLASDSKDSAFATLSVTVLEGNHTNSISFANGEGFCISPNPAVNGSFKITNTQGGLSGLLQVDILNLYGQPISKKQYHCIQNKSFIEITGLPAGVFVIKLTSRKKVEIKIVVVE